MRRTAARRARACLTLTALAGVLAAGSAHAAEFVYTANADGNVRPYAVGASGLLTPLAVTVTAGTTPTSITVSPDGASVYVTDRDADAVYQYDAAADGTLTPKSPATVALPAGSEPTDLDITPDGRHAYVPTNAVGFGGVHVADIDSDGDLAFRPQPVTTGSGANSEPLKLVVGPQGRTLYVTNFGDGTVSQFALDASGTPTPLSPATVAAGPVGGPLAVRPDGASLYVGLIVAGNATIAQYDIGAAGTLTPKATPTVAAGASGLFDLAVAPDGATLYGTNPGSGESAYAIAADGSLGAAQAGTTPASVRFLALSFDSDSLYGANQNQNTIAQRQAGPPTAPKTPGSVASAGGPGAIAITRNADLAASVASTPGTVDETLTYTVTATNVQGYPTPASVRTVLPSGLTFVSATSSTGGTCSGSGTVTCDVGILREGRSAVATIRARATGAGTIPLTATADGLLPDPRGANDTDATQSASVTARPGATTAPASAIAQTTATLNGVVTPSGTNTRFRFEYGTTEAYGTTTGLTPAGAGGLQSAAITGLAPSTTYHFRVVAVNDEGATVNGADATFTTAASPAPVLVAVPGPAPSPVRDTKAPSLTRLVLSKTGLKATLSERATVKATIQRRRTRRVGGKLRTTYTTVRTVTIRATRSGATSVKLKRLAKGSYRVTAKATDAAGNASKTVTARATIR